MFPKIKRIVDEDILEKYRKRRCDICGSYPRNQPCHIKSRGAGGPDCDDNLFSGCPVCHIKQGTIGFFKLCEEFPFFRQILAQKGWTFGNMKKLIRTRSWK